MYPSRARPLLIVGRQRAGTRFLANVLNTFAEVSIQGELPNPVMQLAEKFILDLERAYQEVHDTGGKKGESEYKGWLKKKEDLIYALWEHAGQSRRVPYDQSTRYFGYKRPNNEAYFAFYEASFTHRRPLYIYCTRNFVDNYLSIASRWPERSIGQVGQDYLMSTEQYREMKAAAPGRVLIFNLDDYLAEGIPYLARNIFRPLRLKLAPEQRQEIARMGATNRTEEDLKLLRRRELTPTEVKYLLAHPEIEMAYAKLCAEDTEAKSSKVR